MKKTKYSILTVVLLSFSLFGCKAKSHEPMSLVQSVQIQDKEDWETKMTFAGVDNISVDSMATLYYDESDYDSYYDVNITANEIKLAGNLSQVTTTYYYGPRNQEKANDNNSYQGASDVIYEIFDNDDGTKGGKMYLKLSYSKNYLSFDLEVGEANNDDVVSELVGLVDTIFEFEKYSYDETRGVYTCQEGMTISANNSEMTTTQIDITFKEEHVYQIAMEGSMEYENTSIPLSVLYTFHDIGSTTVSIPANVV